MGGKFLSHVFFNVKEKLDKGAEIVEGDTLM